MLYHADFVPLQPGADRNAALIRAELTAGRPKDCEAKGQAGRFWGQYSIYRGPLRTGVSSPAVKAAIWTRGAIWTGSMNISTQLV